MTLNKDTMGTVGTVDNLSSIIEYAIRTRAPHLLKKVQQERQDYRAKHKKR